MDHMAQGPYNTGLMFQAMSHMAKGRYNTGFMFQAMDHMAKGQIELIALCFRPRITWLKDGIELASFSEHEHVSC